MRSFVRTLLAEARKQHRVYFHGPLVYFSVFIWPLIELVTAYYLYQPFMGIGTDGASLERGGGSSSLTGFLVIGFLGYNFFFSLIQSAWRFSFERTSGTLELILLTPANRFAVILGNAAAALLESVWLLTGFFIATFFILPDLWNNANFWLLPFGLLALTLAAMAWGALLNTLFLLTRDNGFFYTILQEPLSFFSGVRFPIALFANWMRVISYALPLTYCLIILRKIALDHAMLPDIALEIGALAGLIVLMLAASYLLLGYAERRAKRTGSLTLF
jgi:ABC-2 type transport system permease protein